ncbi:MAG: SDR family NAD(P)-dependent oxidoreductase [Pseudomonadota bacterium]
MGMSEGAVLVVGGTGDIGASICERLADAGHRVVISGRTIEQAEQACESLANAERVLHPVKLLIDDGGECRDVVKQVAADHGGLSAVVNCAGVSYIAPVLLGKDADWERVVRVNTLGAFNISRAALRPMIRARFGRIIHVGSISAEVGAPYNAIYAASKAGVAGMVRSLALEVAALGITVNAVQPGYVKTKLFAQTQGARAKIKGVSIEEHEQDLVDDTPTGRLVTPEDVASLVNYLATDESRSITGQTLNVDGGRTAN